MALALKREGEISRRKSNELDGSLGLLFLHRSWITKTMDVLENTWICFKKRLSLLQNQMELMSKSYFI